MNAKPAVMAGNSFWASMTSPAPDLSKLRIDRDLAPIRRRRRRKWIWLATVANIAPLLGFLGTVSGMIHAFEAIAAAEEVSAKLVATGIYEALITTAAGLIVAIPVQTAHNYFVSRIDKFVIDMEESGAELIDALTTHADEAKPFVPSLREPTATTLR